MKNWWSWSTITTTISTLANNSSTWARIPLIFWVFFFWVRLPSYLKPSRSLHFLFWWVTCGKEVILRLEKRQHNLSIFLIFFPSPLLFSLQITTITWAWETHQWKLYSTQDSKWNQIQQIKSSASLFFRSFTQKDKN